MHDIIVTNDLDNDDRNRMADSDSDDEYIRQYFQTAYILVYVCVIGDNNDGAHWNNIEIGSFIIPTNKFVEITGVYMDH